MSEPKRLLADPSLGSFQRGLLEGWDAERPRPQAREEALAALGAGVAVAGVKAGLTATSAGGASIAPKGAIATLGWLKWLGLGVVALGGAGAAVVIARHREPEAVRVAAPAPAVASSGVATATSAADRIPTTTIAALPDSPTPFDVPLPTTSTAPTASIGPTTAAPRDSTTASPSNAGTPDAATAHAAAPITEQLTTLEGARAALERGDPALARELADAYATHYPRGAFLQEAEALRIQALARSGHRVEAERGAARFRASYPKSPHLGRIEAALGAPP